TAGQSQFINVNVGGVFTQEDSVTLSSSSAMTIAAPNVNWNNNGGGTFAFLVTPTSGGPVTFTANESAYNASASSSNDIVTALSSLTVDDNISLALGQSGTVNV